MGVLIARRFTMCLTRCDAENLTISGPASYCVSSCFHRGVIYETLRPRILLPHEVSSIFQIGKQILPFYPSVHSCRFFHLTSNIPVLSGQALVNPQPRGWASVSILSGCLTFGLMACGLRRPPPCLLCSRDQSSNPHRSPEYTDTQTHGSPVGERIRGRKAPPHGPSKTISLCSACRLRAAKLHIV